MPAIGIDLGTTNTCVGVWQDGRVEIISNSAGYRVTPSIVAYAADQRLVGDAAKVQAARNPESTVFDAKRLIGRKFSEEVVQKDMKGWPFDVVKGASDAPMIRVLQNGEAKLLTAQEVSAAVLGEMKRIAEDYLDTPVQQAVITVPAYFDNAQRQATIDAGKIAGLEVLRIINEPTAAALAYGLEKKKRRETARNVLIFDVGGGTCDVSVLNMKQNGFKKAAQKTRWLLKSNAAASTTTASPQRGYFQVLATNGDTHLGGADFDQVLLDYFVKEFKADTGHDITGNKRALRRLRTAAEVAKRTLSTTTTAACEVDALYAGQDFYTSITRTRLEHLCADLFQKCVDPIKRCLEDAELQADQVNEVVLVGGSTRIPKLQALVQDLFKGKALSKGINADEAVAHGAAIQAAMLTDEESLRMDVRLSDITPLSLGVANHAGEMRVIVPRNTPVPHTRTDGTWQTAVDDSTFIIFRIHEGERTLAKDNRLLDHVTLHGFPSGPRGQEKFSVRFQIDADGILSVTAKHKGGLDIWKSITVRNSGKLSDKEIERMIADAEQHRQEDQAALRQVAAKRDLEDYVYDVKHTVLQSVGMLSDDSRREVEQAVKDTFDWLRFRSLSDVEDYRDRKTSLQDLVSRCC